MSLGEEVTNIRRGGAT